MGYIRQMYGPRSKEFFQGFMAAVDTYAVWRNGTRWIGSPEQSVKQVEREARIDLLGDEEPTKE